MFVLSFVRVRTANVLVRSVDNVPQASMLDVTMHAFIRQTLFLCFGQRCCCCSGSCSKFS